jgi:nitrous oxide reductase
MTNENNSRETSETGLSRRAFMTAAAFTTAAVGSMTLGGLSTPARAAGKDPKSL